MNIDILIIWTTYKKNYKGERNMWQTLKITEIKKKLRTNFDFGLTNEEVRKKINRIWRKQT